MNNVLNLIWMKGHIGNFRNEVADVLATTRVVGPKPIIPLTLTNLNAGTL